MATLISQIIQDAYREANIIAAETSPTSNQATEGLRLLNRYIRALMGNELGQPLSPVPYGQNNVNYSSDDAYYYDSVLNYFIPANSRVVANLTEAKSLNLTPNPEDGDRVAISDASGNFSTNNVTLSGNGRMIEGATTVTLNTDGEDVEYFYRADTSNWVKVTDLLSVDVSPFPSEFDDLLIVGLSMRLAPRYGTATTQESANTYRSMMTKFRSRYGTTDEVRSELGLLRLPLNKNHYGWPYTDDYFDRGVPYGF